MSSGEAVRTLAVVCEQWPAVVVGRPPEVPVAVLFANRCVAVSSGARRHGVEPGLRRREAQARCPSIELVERDEQLEARRFEVVLSELEQIAVRLEVLEAGRLRAAHPWTVSLPRRRRGVGRLVHDRVGAVLAEHLGGGTLPCPVGRRHRGRATCRSHRCGGGDRHPPGCSAGGGARRSDGCVPRPAARRATAARQGR